MFSHVSCKDMKTRKVVFGAEIEIFVFFRIKNSVDCRNRWNTYWSGRKSYMLICVVWRFNFFMLVKHSLDFKVTEGMSAFLPLWNPKRSKTLNGVSMERQFTFIMPVFLMI